MWYLDTGFDEKGGKIFICLMYYHCLRCIFYLLHYNCVRLGLFVFSKVKLSYTDSYCLNKGPDYALRVAPGALLINNPDILIYLWNLFLTFPLITLKLDGNDGRKVVCVCLFFVILLWTTVFTIWMAWDL